MVSTLRYIDKTPMVISADDIGYLKIWDLRQTSCIQTVELDSKNVVSQILDI